MKFIILFLFLITSLFASRDGGPYLGVGYGLSSYGDGGYYDSVKNSSSNSLTYYAGAYINKHLSVELDYASFNAKGHGDSFNVVKNNEDLSLNFSVVSVSVLAHYAFFKDKLDCYARFGAGKLTQSNISDTGATMVYGTGVSYRFNKSFSMKLAYDTYRFGYDENNDKASDYRMDLDHIYTAFEVQF